MKNYYYLQYQILLFALASFFIFYSFLEYPFVLDIYSITNGLNSEDSFQNRMFYQLYLYISQNLLLLKILFLSRIPISIGFLFNRTRKICFFLMLINITIFQHIGNVRSPDVEFLNFLMLALIAIPESKFTFFSSYKNKFWMYPRTYHFLIQIVAGLAYTTSGYYKLLTPKWYNGTYILNLLEHSSMRNFNLHLLLPHELFYSFSVISNYTVLFIELLALPMLFNKHTRAISFILLTLMHVFIFFLLDAEEISLGLLVFHIFLFDPRWLRIRPFNFKGLTKKLRLASTNPS